MFHRFFNSAKDGTGKFHWSGFSEGVDFKGNPKSLVPGEEIPYGIIKI